METEGGPLASDENVKGDGFRFDDSDAARKRRLVMPGDVKDDGAGAGAASSRCMASVGRCDTPFELNSDDNFEVEFPLVQYLLT